MTTATQQDEGALLNRAEWLRAHGFEHDPFPMESFRGEADPILLEAFLDPDDVDFEQLVGTPEHKGYFFVFSAAGGGKTSLYRRVKSEFERQVDTAGRRSLVVEYRDHLHDGVIHDERQCVLRLAQLIEQRLGVRPTAGPRPSRGGSDPDAAYGQLQRAIGACWRQGFDAVHVLIDVDSPWRADAPTAESADERDAAFVRVLPLALSSRLLNIDRLIFKFFLPSEYKPAYGPRLSQNGRFPLYEVQWDEGRLRRALEQRLIACQSQESTESVFDPRPDRSSSGISILAQLCVEDWRETIAEAFVELGVEMGGPRAMWQLGYYLLEEHFCRSLNARRRRRDDRIKRDVLDAAYARLLRELPVYPRHRIRRPEVSTCRQIKDLVAQGSADGLAQAIDLLRPYNENSAITMLSWLKRTVRDYNQGLILRSEYDATLNRIVCGLLQEIEQAGCR